MSGAIGVNGAIGVSGVIDVNGLNGASCVSGVIDSRNQAYSLTHQINPAKAQFYTSLNDGDDEVAVVGLYNQTLRDVTVSSIESVIKKL